MPQSRLTPLPASRPEGGRRSFPTAAQAESFLSVRVNAKRKENEAQINAAGILTGFLHFAGADARGTNAKSLASAADHSADATQVRFPSPSRDVVRVADVVAVSRTLTADFTRASHENTSSKL